MVGAVSWEVGEYVVSRECERGTYIFCATSAPLRFFSYSASIACCSCFTSFACPTHEPPSQPSAGDVHGILHACMYVCTRAHLLDGELLIRLDADLARFLLRLLLDERDLAKRSGRHACDG